MRGMATGRGNSRSLTSALQAAAGLETDKHTAMHSPEDDHSATCLKMP